MWRQSTLTMEGDLELRRNGFCLSYHTLSQCADGVAHTRHDFQTLTITRLTQPYGSSSSLSCSLPLSPLTVEIENEYTTQPSIQAYEALQTKLLHSKIMLSPTPSSVLQSLTAP